MTSSSKITLPPKCGRAVKRTDTLPTGHPCSLALGHAGPCRRITRESVADALRELRNAERAFYGNPTDERLARLKAAEKAVYPQQERDYMAKAYQEQQQAACWSDNDLSTVTHDPR